MEKWEKEKDTKDEQLRTVRANLTIQDKWISNQAVNDFAEVLNNDNKIKDTIFDSPCWFECGPDLKRKKQMIKTTIRIVKKTEGNLMTTWVILLLQLQHQCLVVIDINEFRVTLCDSSVLLDVPKEVELMESGNFW